MTASVTDDNFSTEVLESKELVLIDFWAPWCGPCKMLTPIIDELAVELLGKVKILKMNIDENPNIASSLGIRSIPTLMVFKDGKNIDSKIGVLSKDKISQWLHSALE